MCKRSLLAAWGFKLDPVPLKMREFDHEAAQPPEPPNALDPEVFPRAAYRLADLLDGLVVTPFRRLVIEEAADGAITVESSKMTRRERRGLLEQATAVIQRIDSKR